MCWSAERGTSAVLAARLLSRFAPALVGLTRKSPRAIAGGFVDDGGALGHRLRDGSLSAAASGAERVVPIVIVGGRHRGPQRGMGASSPGHE